jgi:uncharacterized membrane protein YraQ (UPF0718 family)
MEFLNALWDYILVSAPFLLFGLLLAGFVHEFISMEKVKKWLGGNSFISVLRAAVIGIPLPLCSCSVIPTAVTLKKSGASNAATSAFLIATPESGIDSISLTYALIDLPMAIIRPVAAFFSALIAGLLQSIFNKDEVVAPENEKKEAKPCCSKTKEASEVVDVKKENRISRAVKFGYGSLVNDIAKWLAIGLVAGAAINFIVPDEFFVQYGSNVGRYLILLIGIPLYICATASTPIAVSLMLKGLSPGAALILLLVGPATNISNIAVLQKYIGKKGVIINMLSIGGVALIFSYITDWLYETYFTLELSEKLMNHEHGSQWWEIACGILLSYLILKGIYMEEIKPRFKRKLEAKGSEACH